LDQATWLDPVKGCPIIKATADEVLDLGSMLGSNIGKELKDNVPELSFDDGYKLSW
jgi:hypothetical protein